MCRAFSLARHSLGEGGLFSTMNTIRSTIVLALLIVGMFVIRGTVHAASLSMMPATSAAKIGKPMMVKLVLGSAKRSVNSAQATITFPKKLLKFTKVSTKGSVFSLWAKNPKGSNKTGMVVFVAGKKNPGFKGKSATILRMTFVPKKAGMATVKITKAKTLANDGKGTNVLKKVRNAKVQIR